MIRSVLLLTILFAAAASSANDARIGPFDVYAIDGGFADPDRTSMLYRIDPETGEVAETVGDTGLRLNAITYWPLTGSIIGVTSSSDPDFPDHLVEIDHRTASADAYDALQLIQGQPDGPIEFADLAAFRDRFGELSLAMIRSEGLGMSPSRDILWQTLMVRDDGRPRAFVRRLYSFSQLGRGPSGIIGIAAADWTPEYVGLATIGCSEAGSRIEPPPISVLPPTAGEMLPDPTCLSAALRIDGQTWIGVYTNPSQNPPRLLARMTRTGQDAEIEYLDRLPDNTVGLAFGPKRPAVPVPALSIGSLFLLLVAVLGSVVFRRAPSSR